MSQRRILLIYILSFCSLNIQYIKKNSCRLLSFLQTNVIEKRNQSAQIHNQ
jgi:hypothetical protein